MASSSDSAFPSAHQRFASSSLNVLRSGTVLDETDDDPRSVATREVNERAIADERVDVAMLGVADGITLALKR